MTPVHPEARIGHVHLKVADLDRAIAFYSGVLGFELQQKFGTRAAFLSAGGYHHHLGLNTWESLGGTADHGVSEAIYVSDPDGNGVELYRDRPESEWPRDAAGNLAMVNDPIDLTELLSHAPAEG